MKVQLGHAATRSTISFISLATALLVAMMVLGASPAAAASCGTVTASSTQMKVKTSGVGCSKGKSVVRQSWDILIFRPVGARVRVGSFGCVKKSYYEGYALAVRCASGSKVAKGYYGEEGS